MVVDDERGRVWHVKQGNEAGPEVVASRILSASAPPAAETTCPPSPSLEDRLPINPHRFRLTMRISSSPARWEDNPYAAHRPTRRCSSLVAMNSADLKNANNTLYELTNDPGGLHRWFVVRDLGTSFDRCGASFPHRTSWRSSRGIRSSSASLKRATCVSITAVHNSLWTESRRLMQRACALIARLSDEQWQQAFRAGGFAPELAARFINRSTRRSAKDSAFVALKAWSARLSHETNVLPVSRRCPVLAPCGTRPGQPCRPTGRARADRRYQLPDQLGRRAADRPAADTGFTLSAAAAQPKGPAPTPEHTGFRPLLRDLVNDVTLPSSTNAIIATLGGGAALAVHPADVPYRRISSTPCRAR
jgi:hypothetical protein